MLFVIRCIDAEKDTMPIRADALSAHLSWVEDNMETIRVAGPLINNETGEHEGSMYVVEADSKRAAERFLASDPYYQAEIWQQVTYTEFKAFAGTWVGGKNWPGS